MEAGDVTERRNFALALIYGLWGLIAAALGLPAAAYLLVPPSLRKEAEWVEAGSIAELRTGVPEQVVFRRNRVDGWKVISEKTSAWVLKKADNQVVAFAPQCTHLGCGYYWDERKGHFVCPCHSSTFSSDGTVLGGPAPRPLDQHSVKLEGQKLWLGPLSKPAERSA